MDGHLPSLGWSSTNPRMVTHQKEVYYRLGIWHLDLTQKTNTRFMDFENGVIVKIYKS